MKVSDYYYPETPTSAFGYGLGRGVRVLRTVTIEPINPFKASAIVGAAWGGVAAIINARKYKRGEITKRDAVLDTAGESVRMGLSAGLGLVVSNAVRASTLAVTASSLVPFTVGLVVTAGAKVLWNCATRRHLRCQTYILVQEGTESAQSKLVNRFP